MNITPMIDMIREHYRTATLDQKAAGWSWYNDAQATTRCMADSTGHERSVCAGVIAALSPRNRWANNVSQAWDMLEGKEVRGLSVSIRKAERIIQGKPIGEVLGKGWKTAAFFANISGDESMVTVDVWAARAVGCGNVDLSNERNYGDISAAYQFAAAEAGITPAQMQATVWIVVRGSAV